MGYRTNDRVPIRNALTSHRSYTILDIEIDNHCGASALLSHTGCSQTPPPLIDLHRYEDIPGFLKGNPFIKHGYRAHLPASHCLSSLFMWNNETINIWSHLLGFFIFGAALMTDILYTAAADAHFSDRIYTNLGLLCFMVCMVLSAGYHVFYCHSQKACRRWLALDLAGVSIGIIGCYLPGVHLAFYCHQVWRDFYMLIVFCLGVISFGIQFHPRFLSSSWDTYRMILYSSVAGYGIIPALHWIYLSGGFHTEIVQLFFGKVVIIYLLAMLALLFYITKFPERMFPGKVDYIGSSHQWWHIIIVLAFLHWHQAGERILQYRMDVPCQY